VSAELFYKTTTPEIVAWYREAMLKAKTEAAARTAYADKLTAEIGPGRDEHRDLYISRGWGGETRVTGIAESEAEYRTKSGPEGLRYDRSKGFLVPALRTARGKQYAAEFEALKGSTFLNDIGQFGVPSGVHGSRDDESGNTYRFTPGFEIDDDTDTLYLLWGSSRIAGNVEESLAEHPEIAWEKVPRSEWYAREESKAVPA
jgi:hypothetical protein